ncbi:MAG: putative rRNA maturation factor [Sphingobacteriales bacterium]|jgi:probable rRNA maturation factor
MAIQFFNEDIDFKLLSPQKSTAWITKAVEIFGFDLEEINYIFCSDEHLLNINKEYLNHDYYTDIITFDNSPPDSPIIFSDIFISIDRVADNAKDQNINFEDELDRVMIHGLLHLLGLKDKTEEEEKKMRSTEDEMLALR